MKATGMALYVASLKIQKPKSIPFLVNVLKNIKKPVSSISICTFFCIDILSYVTLEWIETYQQCANHK